MRMRAVLSFSVLGLALAVGCEDCNTQVTTKKDATNVDVDCVIDALYNAESAQDITPDQIVDGTICPQGFDDKDYYRVTTGPSDGILEVHLYNDTGFTSVDLRAALLDASGTPTPMAFSNPNGTGAVTDIRGAFGVSPSTTYIIEVSDEGGDDGDPTNPYHLEIALSPQPDSNEPNDTAQTATTGGCGGQAVAAYLGTRGDRDYYQCIASAMPMRLKVRFQGGAELGWQPHLYIANDQGQALLDTQLVPKPDGSYDFVGAVAVTRFEANSARPELSQTFSHSGAVTVLVEDVSGDRFNFDTTTGRYDLTLTVDTGPGNDTEPAGRNDAPGTATSVNSGQTLNGYLATYGDVDWYTIDGADGRYVLEVELNMPADGVVPESVDPDRVGVSLEIYDARLSVASGGTMSVTTGCTESPANATQFARCDNFNATTDRCRDAHGEQNPVCMPGSYCGESRWSRLILQGADANRVPRAAQARAGVAVRKAQPILVGVSLFQGQVFHDQQPYTIRFNLVPDPDTREPNDLPPALNREARYSSSAGAIRSCNASNFAIPQIGSYSGIPACTEPSLNCAMYDGGSGDVCRYDEHNGGSCLPWDNNGTIDGGSVGSNPYTSLDCSGAGTGSYTATGQLSFEGDRDYYSFNLPPGDIEVNIDVTGSGASSTGIEPAVFVFTGSQGRLYASFVDADRANTVSTRPCTDWHDCCDNVFECDPSEVPCHNPSGNSGAGLCQPPEECASHTDCPDSYLCIRERCFRDDDSHALPNVTFGPDGGNCLVAPLCGEGNPWIIEITDNGQNDFDLAMQYTMTVRWSCNCPDLCGYCTAPLYYRNCTDSAR
ncbi:MAG: hypothetical protein ABIJ09_01870 [Pseudomonadota bacterium]